MTLREEQLLENDVAVRPVEVVASPALLPPPRSALAASTVRWWRALVVLALGLGVALRFAAHGPFWLDEAQSVAIAAEPLRHLVDALRHDGAPPLWYALLHFWIRAFGDGTWTVRLMSVLPALVSIPLLYRLARRLAGGEVAVYTVVLFAVSPFAIRYAGEARMYSLVLMFSLLGAHALLAVHRRPGFLPVAGLAAATAALLYTHYYGIWLVLVVGGTELFHAVRRTDRGSRRAVIGIAAGAVTFLPWLPVLAFQSAHTGAPWEAPPSLNAILDTVDQWAGGSNPAARAAGLLMLLLAAVAVFGRPSGRHGIVVVAKAASLPLRLVCVVGGTIALAVLSSIATGNAYASRYTSVVAGLFLVLVGMGLAVLPSQRWRRVLVAVLVVAGVGVSIDHLVPVRTQAGDVASGINALARPGDVVAYCPDQLGPSVSRLVRVPVRQVVFPDFAGPQKVDWVDYGARMSAGSAPAFARQVDGAAGTHTVWLVYTLGYRALHGSCDQIVTDLADLRGAPRIVVDRHPSVGENASLLGFTPRG